MSCNYEIGIGIGSRMNASSYVERCVDCFVYIGEDDNQFIKNFYYKDYNLFIGITNSCKSAKTSGLKYRREGLLYKFLGYEPQILIKGRWYNQKYFKAVSIKESEFKSYERHQTIYNLLQLDNL